MNNSYRNNIDINSMKKKQISPAIDFAKIILFALAFTAIFCLLSKCSRDKNKDERELTEMINYHRSQGRDIIVFE